ncbi:MAG: hypothetical protein OEX12_00255 [Gammaproteobacteria bacterium]|nr:hypothetical protein [Gammaproteobacteria bacterium]
MPSVKEECPLCEARKTMKRLHAENKDLISRNAFLRQRPDLPVDRIPAYEEMNKKISELEWRLMIDTLNPNRRLHLEALVAKNKKLEEELEKLKTLVDNSADAFEYFETIEAMGDDGTIVGGEHIELLVKAARISKEYVLEEQDNVLYVVDSTQEKQ